MTVSSFRRNYDATPGTLFGALWEKKIDVCTLAQHPEMDLREPCNIWLSAETGKDARLPIKRIGCIELSTYTSDQRGWRNQEHSMLASIQAYFRMLDIASVMGIPVETIVLPALGSGNQKISEDFILVPLLNECLHFLKANSAAKRIMIITFNHAIAFKAAMTLEQSYSFQSEAIIQKEQRMDGEGRLAFISYSSGDKNIADNLCAKLEAVGIRVWYAPRDIHSSDYATSIVEAITRCTHFIVILSKNSVRSNHVLNEIDLAFRELNRGIIFMPLRIDEEELEPAFLYYLSRQHWMDAHVPPLEKRLNEFVEKVRTGQRAALEETDHHRN